MRNYSLYDTATGLFTGRTFGTDLGDDVEHARTLALNTPAGQGAIEGLHHHLSRRVDVERLAREDSDALTGWDGTGDRPKPPVATAAHVIDYQPPQPSPDHVWQADTKRWALSGAAQTAAATSAAASARIAVLEAMSGPLVRRMILAPDETTRAKLLAIDAEIASYG